MNHTLEAVFEIFSFRLKCSFYVSKQTVAMETAPADADTDASARSRCDFVAISPSKLPGLMFIVS